MLRPIRRAIFSVSDKSQVVDLAKTLCEKYGVELVATGGTKSAILEAKLPVRDVSELTQFPEVLDGRVKTLHPAVFAGILARRDHMDHVNTLAEHQLLPIDLVVCNLYPFEQTIAKSGTTEADAIEKIDIGGPTLLRAAAKNFENIVVLTGPKNYAELLQELQDCQGQTRLAFRRRCAAAAFALVTKYDTAIRDYFGDPNETYDISGTLSATFMPTFERVRALRQGENPHQQAMLYREEPPPTHACITTASVLHGKELSYNNILDSDSALALVREFTDPAAVVIKHNNPCGSATATSLVDAFQLAWAGDPVSAFGGILAFNRRVDSETAAVIMEGERFLECLVAPDFEPAALESLKSWKKNVRILKTGPLSSVGTGLDYRRIDGGLLVQARDRGADDITNWQCVTSKKPTAAEYENLWFSWLVCKHVKSNAIVISQVVPASSENGGGLQIVGVGAGQMSRIDSMRIAIQKAGPKAPRGVIASDAFFPFPDNVEVAAKAGISAIVQPGGSVKDAEVIAACEKHGIAMIFTGVRHFRH